MINWITADEADAKPGFYGVGFEACHYNQYIPAEIMELVDAGPALPPIPEDDFDDIPLDGQKQ